MSKHWLSVALLLGLAACQSVATPPAVSLIATPVPAVTVAPTIAPTNRAPLYLDATQTPETRAADLLTRMTLVEKIGQMTQIEHNSLAPEAVTRYALGSVLSGGDGIGDNAPETWRNTVLKYEQAALATRLKIPLLYGIDAVHGNAHVHGAVVFPHNIGLGATRNAALVEKIGRATAAQMAAIGVRWNFAPVLAVPQDIRWGRTYEAYSENTALVSKLGSAYLQGLQNVDGKTALNDSRTVLATPKHFIGDGGTKFGTSKTTVRVPYLLDQGDAQMDEATLRKLFLPPYQAAVKAGAQAIMASFSSWNGTKMHANKFLLTDVLKSKLGFRGFVVSDWQAIDQINPNYDQAVATAINAGVDMSMEPYNAEKFIAALTRAVERGDVPASRIDDAVRRILTVKFKMGLFETPIPDADASSLLDNAAQRALARQAVQESLVLLKNDAHTLPLAQNTPLIFVAGEAASSTGFMSGGWTIAWQGTTQDVGGTNLLNAIKQAVSPQTRVEYNRFAKFENFKDAQGNALRADVGIVVVAEPPYAEGVGDRQTLALDENALAQIKRMRAVSTRVVVILLSGRPMVIDAAWPDADVFVAAWLPGTEGAGVADVLFGVAPFTGKLPYTWPRKNSQLPIDFNAIQDAGCDAPLFPYGFGLSTRDASPVVTGMSVMV